MRSSDTTILRDELVRRGLIVGPGIDDSVIVGRGTIATVGYDVTVSIDPELTELGWFDPDLLADRAERLLNLQSSEWTTMVATIASEIQEAVGDIPVAERTDLRIDLTVISVVVFADAFSVAFHAPKQFPDSVVRVQLDDDLQVEDLEVEFRDTV